jgi:Tol biopolymer transport system component
MISSTAWAARWIATTLLLSCVGVSGVSAQTVHVELLSKNPAGITPAGGSRAPWMKALSADGRFVLFQSAAPDLVPGQVDANLGFDLFLLDREANATRLVSHRAGRPLEAANASSFSAVSSSNGRFVAFTSAATDLVAGTGSAVFLYDWQDESIRPVPRMPSASVATPGWSYPVGVSDTGWVLFSSESMDYVEGDTPDSSDAFLFDPVTNQVRLVSHVAGEPRRRPAYGSSKPVAISRDGRWTFYDSSSPGLDASLNSPDYMLHAYVYDRDTDTSRLVSRSSAGTPGNGYSEAVALTPDGKFALFQSTSSNLSAAPDVNEDLDAFVFELASGELHSLSVGVSFADGRSPASTFPVGISDDGRRVLLRREIGPPLDFLGPFPDPPYDHAYVYDLSEGTVRLATHVNGEPTKDLGGTEVLGISGDGSSVIYASWASPDPEVLDDNRELDVFLYDVASDRSRLVSGVDGSHRVPRGATAFAQISADASLVLLHSNAFDLISGLPDNNNAGDMFVHDLRTGRIALCGRASGGVESTSMFGYAYGAVLSPDGSGVALNAFGLVPGRAVGDYFFGVEPFHVDRLRSSARLIVERTPLRYGETRVEALAEDVALLSSSEVRLGDAAVDTNGTSDVFVAALDGTGVPHLLSRSAMEPGRTANAVSWPRAITPSGRYVLFQSYASNLVAGAVDTQQDADVFVFDRETDSIDLVSAVAGSPNVAVGGVDSSAISEDGRWVLASAYSPAMVSGAHQAAGYTNVYLIDREAAEAHLVSHAADDPLRAGDNYSHPVALTPDGRWVVFRSVATDLVAGVATTSGHSHVYLYDRESRQNRLISHQPGAPLVPVNGDASPVAITPDGRHILFHTDAAGLTAPGNDTYGRYDAFVYDVQTGAHTLVSPRAGGNGTVGNHHSAGVALSHDGRRVLLRSGATDLVSGVLDLNGRDDAFLFDVTLNRAFLLSASVRAPNRTANAVSYPLRMTADGTGVLLSSEASDLTHAIDVNRGPDVFFAELDFGPVFSSGFEGAQ